MGLFDALANTGLTLWQNRQNRKIAADQRKFDLDMWNKANAYNSPTEQMKRLKEAGLSPQLVYGNGSVVGNTSTATPRYDIPQQDTPRVGEINPVASVMQVLSNYQDLKKGKEEINLLKKQNIMYDEQAMNYQVDRALKTIQALSGQEDYKFKRDFNLTRGELLKTQVDALRTSIEGQKTTNALKLFDLGMMPMKKEYLQKGVSLRNQELNLFELKKRLLDFRGTGQAKNNQLLQNQMNREIDLTNWGIGDKDKSLFKLIIRAVENMFGNTAPSGSW